MVAPNSNLVSPQPQPSRALPVGITPEHAKKLTEIKARIATEIQGPSGPSTLKELASELEDYAKAIHELNLRAFV